MVCSGLRFCPVLVHVVAALLHGLDHLVSPFCQFRVITLRAQVKKQVKADGSHHIGMVLRKYPGDA